MTLWLEVRVNTDLYEEVGRLKDRESNATFLLYVSLPDFQRQSKAVVVAQLAERSLPIAEVRGSNSDIGKFLYRTFIYCQLYYIEKDEKKKRPGMAHFYIKTMKVFRATHTHTPNLSFS